LLSEAQKKICDSKARFRVSTCGRRFGKTHVALRELAKHASDINKEVLYLAPSYRQAKQIAWTRLKEKLRKLQWVEHRPIAELTIRLKSGSKIYLKGGESKDSLRGNSYHLVVLDEYQDLDPELWTAVIRPSLSDTKGKALFIGTPRGIGSFSHDMYTMAQSTQDWEAFSFTTLDGGQVDEKEIEEARRDLDERTFNQEYLATFNSYSGSVYYNFNREHHIKPLAGLDTSEIHCGIDFNYDPMSVAIAVIQNHVIYFVDEINMSGSNTDNVVEEIKNRYPRSRIVMYPDAAGRQRKTSAGGRTDISILQNAGFRVLNKLANPPIRDRVNAVNSKLKNTNGNISMYIDPKCKQIIRSLERLLYKPNTSVIDQNDDVHMSDAVGYLIDYLYPIKKETETHTPLRWGFSGSVR